MLVKIRPLEERSEYDGYGDYEHSIDPVEINPAYVRMITYFGNLLVRGDTYEEYKYSRTEGIWNKDTVIYTGRRYDCEFNECFSVYIVGFEKPLVFDTEDTNKIREAMS